MGNWLGGSNDDDEKKEGSGGFFGTSGPLADLSNKTAQAPVDAAERVVKLVAGSVVFGLGLGAVLGGSSKRDDHERRS